MTNNGFEILEHTADLKIKVWGSTPEELFKNALQGMAHVQKSSIFEHEINSPADGQKSKVKISITSPDITALLIDFLSEVLTQSQINKAAFYDVKFLKFSDTPSADSGQAALEAELKGVKVNKFDEDIKAVTYHEAEVKKNPEGMYETKLVFDI